MENKIIEGNKMIAEFMGIEKCVMCEPEDCGRYRLGQGIYYFPLEMQYHTSWGWLMPAWKKFYNEVILTEWWHEAPKEILNELECMEASLVMVNLPAAHKHFTNLINWYNTRPNGK